VQEKERKLRISTKVAKRKQAGQFDLSKWGNWGAAFLAVSPEKLVILLAYLKISNCPDWRTEKGEKMGSRGCLCSEERLYRLPVFLNPKAACAGNIINI
jgi:hypothetical protein